MVPTDTLLSLDMGLDDCLYRIRRDLPHARSVIYVHLKDLNLIAEDRRCHGPSVVKDMRKLIDVWDRQWTTLIIFTECGQVKYENDAWVPHFLDPEVLAHLVQVPHVDVLDLEVLHEYKSRAWLVRFGLQRCVLKFCPFGYGMPYFTREVEAYSALCRLGCTLQPKLLAYVFERSENMVIGFLCEELRGRFATSADIEDCKQAPEKLHSYNVIHGDLNRFNFIMTLRGLRLIDFEKAVLYTDSNTDREDFISLQKKEIDGLAEALGDPEEWGKPWSVQEADAVERIDGP